MNDRIRYIDGLRAVAVVLVILDHTMQHGLTSGGTDTFTLLARRVFAEGAHGVDLFFVLSGFCLSYPLLASIRRDATASIDLAKYLAKRFVRIVPPYYAALALCVAGSSAASSLRLAVPYGTLNQVGAGDIMRQALLLDWHTKFINGSFWTLCVEFRWYFLFPAALVLWIRYPRLFTLAMLGLAASYWLTRMHSVDLGTLFPFLLGIVAADLSVRGIWSRSAYYLIPSGALLGLVLEKWTSMETPFGTDVVAPFAQINPGWQIAAFGLVLAVGQAKMLRSILSSRPFVATGVASYSIYLIHEPLVQLIDANVRSVLIAALAAVAVSSIAGAAFWRLFERPWLFGRPRQIALGYLEPLIARGLYAVRVPRSPNLVAETAEAPPLTRLEPVPEAVQA